MKALITGGNGDIGFAISNYLIENNYNTSIIDKNIDRVQTLTKNYKSLQVDFTNTKEVETCLNSITQPQDILIYAAGIREIVPISKLTLDEWQKIQDINLTSAFIISQHLIKLALTHNHPLCIIFISSISGLFGEPERGAYCASKHALIGLAKSLAIELASNEIRVNVIAPGIIDTSLTSPYKKSPNTMKKLKNNIPLGRWGQPEHIVQSVDYIIKNTYLTGSTLIVDGGWTAGKIL